MDPKHVKLTASQKIAPLLKAINKEIPWQLALMVVLSLAVGIFGSASINPFVHDSHGIDPFWDFIVRRLILGAIFGGVTFLATGLTIVALTETVIPMIRKIKERYEEESLKVKKEVLDNVVDDEILLKK